jgi:hypothetical protein
MTRPPVVTPERGGFSVSATVLELDDLITLHARVSSNGDVRLIGRQVLETKLPVPVSATATVESPLPDLGKK